MNQAVAEYTVCEGQTPMQLSKSVMKAIRDGWQPHGSMVVIRHGEGRDFFQPMVILESAKGADATHD